MKISRSGIAPLQQIKSEHLLRIIGALDGTVQNTEILVSGSVTASYFIGDGSQLANLPIPSSSFDTSSLVSKNTFNSFTSSYTTGSFTGSFKGDGSQLIGVPTGSFNTSSLVTNSVFNSFTSSYTTGSFTGSFKGDGSQLTNLTYNIPGGNFTGIFDVSNNKNTFYNDYITGSALILSLTETRISGSVNTVRIKGGLIEYLPLIWNFSGESISTDVNKLNELTVLYVSDSDIRIVNRIVELNNSTKWLITGYNTALFPTQSPAGSISQRDGKIYPSTYGGAGYGNKGLSVKYLPSGVNGSIVFKKETALDSDVVIGFHNSNDITSYSSVKVAMFLNAVNGSINRFESGALVFSEVAIVGYYFKIKRTGSTFTLEKSADGTTWTTISTYTYTNSGNMYLVVDVNNDSANMPNEMYYPQTIGLV